MTDWRDLVGPCPKLMRYALRLTRNRADAEDLVQDTLERAWRFRDRFRGDCKASTWLITIMRREHFRKPKVYTTSEVPEAAVEGDGYAACLSRDLLDRVSPKYREAYALNRDGMAYEDIAARLGVPCGTVKSRINRAQAEIEAAL